MIRDITGTHRIESALDRDGYYCDHTVLCALPKKAVSAWKAVAIKEIELAEKYDLRFLAGAVGSKFVSAYYYLVLTGEGVRVGGGFHTYPETIRQFPIPRLDSPGFPSLSSRVVNIVDRLVALGQEIQGAKTKQRRDQLQRRFAAFDDELDETFMAFYGLTSAERRAIDVAVRTVTEERGDSPTE
jgi:hypothetical protein